MGDFLFNAIIYLLKYSIGSRMKWKNNVSHLKESLRLATHKTLKCHGQELKFEFLYDLHHGNANDEEIYFKKNPFQQ